MKQKYFYIISIYIVLIGLMIHGCKPIPDNVIVLSPELTNPNPKETIATPTKYLYTQTQSSIGEDTSLPISTATIEPLDMQTITRIPTSSQTRLANSTQIPTLSPEENKVRIQELLISNGNCDLPCVWGFIPGGTSEYEIQTFFQKLGWTVTKYNEVDYTGKDFESLMDIDFGFVIQDGILTNLSFGAAGPNYQSIEHAYKLKDVLIELGAPSQIWINLALQLEIDEPAFTASDVFLYYHDLGLLLHYGGSAFRIGDGYRFCPTDYLSGNPENPQHQGAVSIQTGIPELNNSPEDLVAPFGLFGGMLPIQQALMIDEEEFTQTILDSDQSACFITPIEVWQNLP